MPRAKAERFMRTLKYEEVYLNDVPGCTGQLPLREFAKDDMRLMNRGEAAIGLLR